MAHRRHLVTAAMLTLSTVLLLVPVPVWLAAAELVLQLLGIEWRAGPPSSPSPVGFDKLVHFALFFVLALQLRRSAAAAGRTSYWPVVLFCVAYAVGMEVLQGFTGRTADAADALADVLGALVFVGWSRLREARS